MRNDDLEPMVPELLGLLRRGTPCVEDAPVDAQARVLSRLAVALPSQTEGLVPNETSAAARSLVSSKTIVAIAGAFLTGGIVGGVVATAAIPAKVQVVYVERAAPSAAIFSSANAYRIEDLPPAPSASVTPTSKSGASVRVEASEDALNAERVLVDDARTAFARGDADACLATLEKHRSRYPAGVLSEEREALAIRTLVVLERTREARDRARSFVAKYPKSLMRPAIEAAVGGGSPP